MWGSRGGKSLSLLWGDSNLQRKKNTLQRCYRSTRITDKTSQEHIASDHTHLERLANKVVPSQEEEWWEQKFGGRNAWRMGGDRRKDYYEKLESEQEALLVWGWILSTVAKRQRAFCCNAERVTWLRLEAGSPGLCICWSRNEALRAGLGQEWGGKDEWRKQ